MNLTSQLNHEAAFERAWADPAYTQIELPPVDVNRALAERYRIPPEDRVALGDLLRTLTASLPPTPRQEQST